MSVDDVFTRFIVDFPVEPKPPFPGEPIVLKFRHTFNNQEIWGIAVGVENQNLESDRFSWHTMTPRDGFISLTWNSFIQLCYRKQMDRLDIWIESEDGWEPFFTFRQNATAID